MKIGITIDMVTNIITSSNLRLCCMDEPQGDQQENINQTNQQLITDKEQQKQSAQSPNIQKIQKAHQLQLPQQSKKINMLLNLGSIILFISLITLLLRVLLIVK